MGNTTPKTAKQAKTTSKAKPATSNTKTRPGKTDAQIQQFILDAQKMNPPGVRIATKDIEANWRVSAHYTGFPDTASCKEWYWDSDAANRVLEPFMQSFKAHFGGTKAIQVRAKRLFDLASSEEAPEWLDKSVPLPRDPNNPDPTERELSDRAQWTWVISMHKLMRCDPTHFFAEPLAKGTRACPGLPDEKKEPLIQGHTPEDWYRAYVILKTRIRMASRPTTDGTATRRRSEPTEEPLCLTIEQEAARVTGQTVLPPTQMPGAPAVPLQSGECNAPAEYDDLVGAGVPEDVEEPASAEERHKGYDEFDKLMDARPAAAGSLQKLYDQNHARPRLTASAQADLCMRLGKSVKILYPIVDDEHPLVPTTEHVDQITEDFLSEPTNSSTLSERLLRDGNEQVLLNDAVNQTVAAEIRQDNVDAILNEQKVNELRESYMKLQTTLNAVSATPPTFPEACSTLNMDPSRPILELIRDALPADGPATTVRALKPWQVQFLAWARLMEQSELHAWLLADEMGLGKTISALSRVICAYTEAEAKQKSPVQGTDAPGPLTSRNSNGSIVPPGSEKDADPPTTPRIDQSLSDSQGAGPEGHERTATDRKIESIARRGAVVERLQGRQYKPTLILAPSQATNVWKHEIRRYFPDIQARYFFQNPGRLGASRERTLTLGKNVDELLHYLISVPNTAEALRYVVITSYSTWTRRTLYKTDPSTNAQAESFRNSATKSKAGEDVEDQSDNDNDGSHDRVIPSEEAKSWESFCPGVFGRVICDEAQRLKNPFTHSHISVARLRAPILNFLTATPMINRPIDLVGFLHLVWKDEFEIEDGQSQDGADDNMVDTSFSINQEFEQAKAKLALTPLSSPDSMRPFLHFLNPARFVSLMNTPGGGQVDPRVSHLVLPVILQLLQLRRTLASSIKLGADRGIVVIGATIPRAIWTYVELEMDAITMKRYRAIHRECEPLLPSGGFDDEEPERSFINMSIHRRLCQAVHNPLLDQLYLRSKTAKACADKFLSKGRDHGATHFFHATKPSAMLPCYGDRYSFVLYMAALSPKLKVLGSMAHSICNTNLRKLLIFTDWPMIQWEVELFLYLLGFNVVGIRAQHKAAERDDIVESFNDRASNLQILVTSLRISATALNLQNDCSDVIFVDTPSNAQSALQAGGRVSRIGQRRICHMYVLTLNHSYDQTLQWRGTNKMLGILAGQADLTVTDEEREMWREFHQDEIADDPMDTELDHEMESAIIRIKCAALYVDMFGQRSSRNHDEWGYIRDVTRKDDIPEERAFRTFSKLKSNTFMKPAPRVQGMYRATAVPGM